MVKLFGLTTCAFLASVTGNDTSCGGDSPSPVKDCEFADMGSCGNACCIASFELDDDADKSYKTMRTFLESHGPDKSFNYSTGPNEAGLNPGDDLRQYPIKWQYIFQGTHMTTGGYKDYLDISIQKSAKGGSVVQVGSRSHIHGALSDNGQNYKNVVALLDGLKASAPTAPAIMYGCGSTDRK